MQACHCSLGPVGFLLAQWVDVVRQCNRCAGTRAAPRATRCGTCCLRGQVRSCSRECPGCATRGRLRDAGTRVGPCVARPAVPWPGPSWLLTRRPQSSARRARPVRGPVCPAHSCHKDHMTALRFLRAVPCACLCLRARSVPQASWSPRAHRVPDEMHVVRRCSSSPTPPRLAHFRRQVSRQQRAGPHHRSITSSSLSPPPRTLHRAPATNARKHGVPARRRVSTHQGQSVMIRRPARGMLLPVAGLARCTSASHTHVDSTAKFKTAGR